MRKFAALLFCFILITSCGTKQEEFYNDEIMSKLEKATFAGGCFWCMEHPFEKLDGVYEVVSGFAGGVEESPSYEEVSSGLTGHREAVQVSFDPKKVSYENLLDVFWRQIDPTDDKGQFVDRGKQYSSAIFYHDDIQKELAEKSKQKLVDSCRFEKDINTPILPYTSFYPAEDYHQNYYKNHAVKYNFYRHRSGRDQFLDDVWRGENSICNQGFTTTTDFVKPSNKELEEMLSPLQYKVTQEDDTEPAFKNKYYDNKEEGIYVDVVSGEPLFSSIDKYESGTGWPSFKKPLAPENIVEKEDNSLFMKRMEVRSKNADSHIGHVFNDGPEPTGLRYCLNSAALEFIPKEELEEKGYSEYMKLFE